MSEVVGEAVIKVKTDESGVDIDGAGKRAGTGYSRGFMGGIKGLALGIGGVLAATGAVNFLKDSVAEAKEAQKVGATTTSIIKATGSAAGITADQVGAMATRLSNVTGIDDEAIQSGSNLLLTFKNVKNYVDGQFVGTFDRATASAVDLSAAGFGSIESASKTLGKALNDPVKGVSALSRAGVTFTDQQKEQIKILTESGDVLGAQNIILKEVEGQVGGVAEAQATAGQKAAVAWGNLKESIGTALLPVLDQLATFFVDSIIPALYDGVDALGSLGPLFSQIGGFISQAFSGANSGAVTGFFASIQQAAMSVLPVLADLFIGKVLPAVTALGQYLITNVVPIFGQVAGIITGSVIPTIGVLATFLYGTLYPAIIDIVTAVAQNLKPVFDQLVVTFREQILPTLQQVIDQIRTQLIPALEPIVMVVVQIIGFLLKLAATILGFVLPPLIRLAGFIIANVIPVLISIIVKIVEFIGFLGRLGGAIGSAVASFVTFYVTLVQKVVGAVSDVVSAISGLPGKVLAFGGKLLDAGKSLIGSLLQGMKSAATGVGGIVGDVASAVLSAVKDAVNSVIDLFNSAIPNSIGVGPTTVDLPDNPIPHLQAGSRRTTAGIYTVGEAGPERVYLPEGAQVLSAAQTRQQGGGGIDYDALATALAAAGFGRTVTIAPQLAHGDPEAVAMQVFNRLVAAGAY